MEIKNKIFLGDCLDVLKDFPDNSIDSVITDPPYGISFMGKKWDYNVPSVEIWKEVYRVLKPGGHVLSFGGTRTYHRMVVNIEDAGFEIRDQILWIYGSGFPKSLDVSKAIDKRLGHQREIIGKTTGSGMTKSNVIQGAQNRSVLEWNKYSNEPISEEAKQWEGWGSALKPAVEPICLARKPIEGTIVQNVLEWGTGGLNIDGCRVGVERLKPIKREISKIGTFEKADGNITPERQGRYPANIIHDGSEEVLELFPGSKSCNSPSDVKSKSKYRPNQGNYQVQGNIYPGDSGSAARFFYVAKASPSERGKENDHPTVKPINLIKYLVKLITPPNGIVLDPFAGSGTTALACVSLQKYNYCLIEKDEHSFEIIKKRISTHVPNKEKKVEKTKTVKHEKKKLKGFFE